MTKFLLLAGTDSLPLTGNAWEAYSNTSLLLVVLIIVALALPAVTATQQRINFPLAAAATLLSVLVLIEIIIKLFSSRPGGNTYSEVAVGGYLGLLAIIAITVGAFITAREDGMKWRTEAPQTPAGQTPGPGGEPSAPPSSPVPQRRARADPGARG